MQKKLYNVDFVLRKQEFSLRIKATSAKDVKNAEGKSTEFVTNNFITKFKSLLIKLLMYDCIYTEVFQV